MHLNVSRHLFRACHLAAGLYLGSASYCKGSVRMSVCILSVSLGAFEGFVLGARPVSPCLGRAKPILRATAST